MKFIYCMIFRKQWSYFFLISILCSVFRVPSTMLCSIFNILKQPLLLIEITIWFVLLKVSSATAKAILFAMCYGTLIHYDIGYGISFRFFSFLSSFLSLSGSIEFSWLIFHETFFCTVLFSNTMFACVFSLIYQSIISASVFIVTAALIEPVSVFFSFILAGSL